MGLRSREFLHRDRKALALRQAASRESMQVASCSGNKIVRGFENTNYYYSARLMLPFL